jgi:hypothetical protein
MSHRVSYCLTAAFLAAVSCTAANAQTSVSPTTTKPAPAASVGSTKDSISARVENWTEVQWEAAKKEWAKDTTKWASCQKHWNEQKHEGRKNWPALYKCMTSSEG